MFSKGFILSVGLSLCSTILIYLYVKSRINNLENKVSTLLQIIQSHDQLSQPSTHMAGGQCNYEKIVVSDEESSDEESSDEEEEEEEANVEMQEHVEESVKHELVEEEGEEDEEEEGEDNKIMDLTSTHVLHEMKENVEEEDGLDDMDDLDEDLEEDDSEEVVDYSSMGKVELRLLCEQKGFEVKGKKKHELLELLVQ